MDSFVVSERCEKPGVLGFTVFLHFYAELSQRFFNYIDGNALMGMGATGPMCFIILFSVVFTPSPPNQHGSNLAKPVISLLLTNTVSPVRA
jgi:hypothetical protein